MIKILTLITILTSLVNSTIFADSFFFDFETSENNDLIDLYNFSGRFSPKIENGILFLTDGRYAKNHNNAAVFQHEISDFAATENYSFIMHISRGAEGAGFALVNLKYAKEDSLSFKAESWEQPNFKGSFGIGFDVYNPQTSSWFDEFGNFYGREEREISLHWDNKEIFKMKSPFEFRSDPLEFSFYKFDLEINYVVGGALISLKIEDQEIINSYFIPEMFQYRKKPVFGASTSELTISVFLNEFKYSSSGIVRNFKLTAQKQILLDEVFHAGRRNMYIDVDFSDIPKLNQKVILNLDLGAPEGGYSAWDVGAAIYIVDEDSTKYEICRYITPYNRGYEWKVEVTDFLTLFRGKKQVFAKVDTWETVADDPADQKGWKVSARLDFYGESDNPEPFVLKNLWQGNFEYGNPEKPMNDKLEEMRIRVPDDAIEGKIRIVVTGHGMSPNTSGAGEFMPADRTVFINGESYSNLLWNTDCYLNPCRPQDGTWKFDRAGWLPGSVVDAWEIDVTKYLKKNNYLILNYEPMDYINENRGDHYPPHHWFDSQIIFYK